jgi:Domain of unknown function (DUF5658)
MAVASGRVQAGTMSTGELGVFWSAATLLFLNLLDGVFTTAFLQLDLAVEANPLMRWAHSGSPLSFMAVKLAVVQGGVCLLWKNRQLLMAQRAMAAGAALYGGLVAWHMAYGLRLLLS